ncbi:uncharacterized protein LOC121707156 [Alosa sapidissima]|uniref:uncharacterized protein LOC121707156 n=1 Tax=Alosa sapidissima TaxID=34773 RepID=UPI001C0A540A|nr:uncharacterized protein LOC121707156 [Alosa sapidissima]
MSQTSDERSQVSGKAESGEKFSDEKLSVRFQTSDEKKSDLRKSGLRAGELSAYEPSPPCGRQAQARRSTLPLDGPHLLVSAGADARGPSPPCGHQAQVQQGLASTIPSLVEPGCLQVNLALRVQLLQVFLEHSQGPGQRDDRPRLPLRFPTHPLALRVQLLQVQGNSPQGNDADFHGQRDYDPLGTEPAYHGGGPHTALQVFYGCDMSPPQLSLPRTQARPTLSRAWVTVLFFILAHTPRPIHPQ